MFNHPASEGTPLLAILCQGDGSLIADVARMLRELESGGSVLEYDLPRLAQEFMDDSVARASASCPFGRSIHASGSRLTD